jgi:hypothetical protein
MSCQDVREWIQLAHNHRRRRPYEWKEKFPPAAAMSLERRRALMAKWKEELFS